jgi:hypothetical protein
MRDNTENRELPFRIPTNFLQVLGVQRHLWKEKKKKKKKTWAKNTEASELDTPVK